MNSVQQVPDPQTSRFPFPIPFGWFHIAMDDEIAIGEIKTIKAFGRELVLWRAESGELTLQHAYCPHLGAHLGVGGEVAGDSLRCPFHHWEFGGDGKVTAIPYAKKINDKACLKTYPLQVKYGVVMAWYHPDDAPPSYELSDIPEYEDPEYTRPVVTRHDIRTALQEMGENTADGAHFVTVHGHPGAASYDNFEFDGAHINMESTQVFPSSGGPVNGTLKTRNDGFSWCIIRYQTLIEITMLTTNVPVDDNHVTQYFHVAWKNPERDPKIDRIGEAFNKEVNRQLTDDIMIWENKIYEPSPQLCDGDGPISRYRRWASQFYAS